MIISVNKKTFGSFFPWKENIPTLRQSGEASVYNCLWCYDERVECTLVRPPECSKYESSRILEKAWGLTNAEPSIRTHSLSWPTEIDFQYFRIILSFHNPSDLKILQSLFIHSMSPSLNSDTSPFPSPLPSPSLKSLYSLSSRFRFTLTFCSVE